MKKAKKLNGLLFQGGGFLLFNDESNPRLSGADVADKLERHLNRGVIHLGHTSYAGYHSHILQLERQFDKDMSRSARKLANKFNKK